MMHEPFAWAEITYRRDQYLTEASQDRASRAVRRGSSSRRHRHARAA